MLLVSLSTAEIRSEIPSNRPISGRECASLARWNLTPAALNVRSQSTLIAYKGKTETGRSAGDTSAKGIEALMKSAL